MESKNNPELISEYHDLCKKISEHKLPRWDFLPDIDLYMDQVISVMEKFLNVYNIGDSDDSSKIITPSIINNYVKLKVLPSPVKKRYSRTHIAYLIIICILKQTLSISSIKQIIERRLKCKTIDLIYNEFCDMYEKILSDVQSDGNFQFENIVEDVNSFLLRSAISSSTNKTVCEGMISVIERHENDSVNQQKSKQTDRDRKKENNKDIKKETDKGSKKETGKEKN